MSVLPDEEEADRSPWTGAFWCCAYAVGIIFFLVVYGLLQERIMSQPFGTGESAEYFTISAFLVFLNRIVAIIYAISMIGVKREKVVNQAPLWRYFIVSISNVAASWCQYEALKHVTFPVQMLGKSFKMLPVMAWGLIISSKRYSLADWFVAAAVTGGVTEFLLTGSIASGSGHENKTAAKGLILLLCFLLCDGLTSTMQEKCFKDYKVSKYNQMFYVNGCSSIISLITLLAMGDFVPAWAFVGRHGSLLGDAIGLSVASVASQWCIYSQVKEFGALVFAATMNVRQVVSIIVSYHQYKHPITGLQILGLVIVFGALFYKSIVGFFAPTPKLEKPDATTQNVDYGALSAEKKRSSQV